MLGIVWASTSILAQMQIRPGGKPIILGADTICFRYRFSPADTLYYRIESRDSIAIPGFDPVEKQRTEGLRIVCDSVRDDIAFLSMQIEAYSERQLSGNDSSARTRHPWMLRTMRLAIDSLGRRVTSSVDGDQRAIASPGGMFQALRLPIIDSTCRRQNQSWISADTIMVAENGIPAPEVRQQALWRMGDMLDTLGRAAAWMQYTLTGFAGVDIPDAKLNVTTVGAIAEYGRIVVDTELGVPLSSGIWQEVRFKIQSGQTRNTAGRHLVVSTMSLIDVRSPRSERRWRNPLTVTQQPTQTRAKGMPRKRR
jgi:hypothetical protein